MQHIEADGFAACRTEQTDRKRHHAENQVALPDACCHTSSLLAPRGGAVVSKILQSLIRCKWKDARGLCRSTSTPPNAALRKRPSLLLPPVRARPRPNRIFVCN